jgi:hypothetical protein
MVPPSIVKRGIIASVLLSATPLVRGFLCYPSLPVLPAAVVRSPQSSRWMSSEGADPLEVRYLKRELEILQDVMKTKDALVAEAISGRDLAIAAKDKVIELAEKMIVKVEDDLVDAKAEAASTRARFVAEINLRPIVEQKIKLWWKETYPNERYKGMQEMIDRYREKKDTYNAHLQAAMSQISYTNDQGIKGEMDRIYHLMSLPLHDGIKLPPKAPVGYVVNKSESFSVCLSTLLRCFDETHTVMNNDYSDVICHWISEKDRKSGIS